MSLTPNCHENSPEPAVSDVCHNLDNEFMDMQDSGKGEGMNVYARVRPMLDSEMEAGYKECIAAIDDHTVRAVFPPSSAKLKTSSRHNQDVIEEFVFTSAYGPETGQFVFFEECMMNTMQNFIEGQNSLVFSYGSTGSGKTFTLQGNCENPGIIPLSLHLFFASIQNQLLPDIVVKPDKFADVIVLNDNDRKKEAQLKEQLISSCNQEEWNISSQKSLGMVLCETFSEKYEIEERQTTLGPEEMAQAQAAALMKEKSHKTAERQSGYINVWVSFIEIYNENVYDLLQPNINQRTKLNLGEDKNGDVYVKGLKEVCVNNSMEALKLLTLGQKNLKIASTKLNYQSSRSHCIFTVKVIRVEDPENVTYAKVNRLSFCDLAGSERAAKSQTTGMRLKEAGSINTSLLVLGRCLDQLRLNSTLKDKRMIPFRESKLTRLFSGYFTGRGRAVMIANASPSELTFDETLHVLRFSALTKELIIDDSYITTASNTLQTITNMWANTRTNTSNTSSDKSISFEDSMEDVIQEKDELIEKLLDLAESLRNNLEREKKEKAELEMKIRQDVCQEYSEYSDQLLERQRQALEDEQEAIKEVYNKRIANMERMYEKIVENYKKQLNESFSSVDELPEESEELIMKEGDTVLNGVVKEQEDNVCTVSVRETKTEEMDVENTTERYMHEIESLKTELSKVNVELKKTKAELQKVINHATALENASVEMEKQIKTCNQSLQKALAEKEQLKKENEGLQASYQVEIINLERQLESKTSTDKSDEMHVLQEKLKSAQCQLDEVLKSKEDLKEEYEAFKIDFVFYKNDYNNLLAKQSEDGEKLKSLSIELDDAMSECANLKECLLKAENTISSLNQSISVMKDKIADYKEKIQKQDTLRESLVQQEKETKSAKEALKDIDKDLEKALEMSKEYEKRIQELESECSILQNSKDALSKEKENMSHSFAAATEELKTENKNLKMELEKALESVSSLRESVAVSQVQITELTNELDKKKDLVNAMKENEKDYQEVKELFEARSRALENADSISEKLKNKIEILEMECSSLRNSLADMSKNKDNLDDGYTSLLVELESIKQENISLKEKLDRSEKAVSISKALIAELKAQVNQYMKEVEKLKQLEDAKKQMEKDAEHMKKLLEDVKANLENATSFVDEQKRKTELIEAENSSLKNEVVKLQKVQEDLKEKLTFVSKGLESEKENSEMKKVELVRVLQENSDQKEEMNSLKTECTLYKNEIISLQETCSDLKDKLSNVSSEQAAADLSHKEELEIVTKQLENICQLKENLQKEISLIQEECSLYKNEISELKQLKADLEEKLNASSMADLSHKEELENAAKNLESALQLTENLQKEIILVQEECTLHKNKISELQQLVADMEEKISASSNDCEVLHKMVQILQRCEVQASNKAKQLHSSSIKHVEQIMDFEKCIKKKESSIEKLQNEYNTLQKQLKDLQTTLKKQQNEKQKYEGEIELIKGMKAAAEEENENLKMKLNQLEKEKEKLFAEADKLRNLSQKVEEENKNLVQEKGKLSAEVEKLRNLSEKAEEENKNEEENYQPLVVIEKLGEAEKDANRNSSSPNQKSKDQKQKVSIQKSKKRQSVEESEVINIEKVKKETRQKSKEPQPKKKQSREKRESEKTEIIDTEEAKNKKSKKKLNENLKENDSKQDTREVKKPLRRQLRNVGNVADNLNLVLNKDSNDDTKSKPLKRKRTDYISEAKSPAKKTMKLQNIRDIENKPQNLRVQLLKAKPVNEDTHFSPRLTRGRKRICNSELFPNKENNAGNETRRGVRW